MIQDELRALYDQMSDEEKNENSVLKGRFTKYITRRLEWHAIRYAAHKRKSIVTISLDNILDEPGASAGIAAFEAGRKRTAGVSLGAGYRQNRIAN